MQGKWRKMIVINQCNANPIAFAFDRTRLLIRSESLGAMIITMLCAVSLSVRCALTKTLDDAVVFPKEPMPAIVPDIGLCEIVYRSECD